MINKQQQETKQEQETKTEPGQTTTSTNEQQPKRSNNKNEQQQQEDKTSTSTIKQQQQQRSNNTSKQQKQDTTTKPKQAIKIKGVAITDLKEYLARRKMERAAQGPKNNNNANSNLSHTQQGFQHLIRAHRPRLQGISGPDDSEGEKTSADKGKF